MLERIGRLGSFTAHFYGDPKKRELNSEAEVAEILSAMEGLTWSVTSVKRGEKKRSPAPPFITSTLQQEASRKLNMTPKRTMAIAQQLYEGVEVSGEGTLGLITYMRTDSTRLSEDALGAVRDFIRQRHGAEFYAGERVYKTKNAAQDAHEAIRPSNVLLTPERIKNDLSQDQFKLYKLIWDRFVACQMANAVYDVTGIEVACGNHIFRANHQSLRFAGFTDRKSVV